MKINVIFVTFYPDIKLLKNAVESIITQAENIYIIDNTPEKCHDLESFKVFNTIEVIYLGDNKGIAYAQNIGIKKSLTNNADFIMLSDQDTVYPENYIKNMFSCIEKTEQVAAIAPLFNDTNCKITNSGFYKKGFFFYTLFYPKNGIFEIPQAIASGKIINAVYLNEIGLMKEELFIDWIDFEWCWRATNKGYKIIGNANVTITHLLGDHTTDIGFREINLRTPIRHYYITRNAFYLSLRCNDLNPLYRFILFLKSFRYLIGYPILSKPHLTHLKFVLLGFWDGIRGKLGKYS